VEFGFEIVNVKLVESPSVSVVAPKASTIVGEARTARGAVCGRAGAKA
jgi:hypothetical protein